MKHPVYSEMQPQLIKTLGLYQVAGGLVGIIIIVWGIFKNGTFSLQVLLVYLLVILFFAYSIYAGICCLYNKKNALQVSLINQLLQLFSFAVMGYAFKYASGIYLSIGIDLTDSYDFSVGAGISSFTFNFNIETERLEIEINLIALALILWIDRLIKKTKEKAEIKAINTIGNMQV